MKLVQEIQLGAGRQKESRKGGYRIRKGFVLVFKIDEFFISISLFSPVYCTGLLVYQYLSSPMHVILQTRTF